jgi:hypothetical protein
MANNVLKDFSDYVEYFCSIHKKIAHSPEKKHFVRLDHPELAQAINSEIYFPVVTLEKLTLAYSDMPDNPNKSQCIEMLFLDRVPDAGDFKHIEDVQSRMEQLAESFIFKTKKIARSKKYEVLKHIRISNAEMEYVSNIKSLLWGVLLSFDLEFPISECAGEDDFIE